MSGDFTVLPDQVLSVANALHGSAEDLRAIRSGWDRQTNAGAAAFGTTECAAAFHALQESWFAALDDRVSYLASLGDAARDSAKSYLR